MLNSEKLKKIAEQKQTKAKTLLSDRFKKIEEKAKELKKGKIIHVSLVDLEENPYQPRLDIEKNELTELVESIKENGLLQPILIAPYPNSNNKYYILAGHRRAAAFKELNKETIEAILIEDKNTEKELASIAMIENIQRVQLNPIEEAILYKRMIDAKMFSSIREMAKKIGKDHSNISKKINLLKLSPKIIEDVVKNKTTKDVTGLSIINSFTKDYDKQWNLYQILINKGREYLREYVKKLKNKYKANNVKPLFKIKNYSKGAKIEINKKLSDEQIKFLEGIIKKMFEK